jgi:nucleoside-diphosphate-sugar epimerase
VSRVLLTGATGFIGQGALKPLLDAGHEVHAVSTRPAPEWSPEGVIWHEADLLETKAAERVMRESRPQRLLHFAWDATPGAFWTSEENLRWVEATLHLLRRFAANGGERAVLAGSCAEYAWTDETICIESTTTLAPATLYGAAKNALRLIAEAHALQAGYELAWGRIFFVFGPREDERRLGGSVATALAKGQPAETSHGEQVRDFLYAPELAEAFVAVLASPVTGALNVASGQPTRIRDLVEALGTAAGRPDLIRLGVRSANPAEPQSLTADVSRLRDEVGWTPSLSLAEASAKTMDWFREHER